ncbi:MAG TPA: exodeoxyribonuclease VII large subunit [Candidatus Lustribacter sp.]|nr:exodeoxyribonuclease VII large subunit [Candidatus Lustribacter sp.]
MTGPSALPERALDTSADNPWPVRVLSLKIAGYVDKMSPLWVEGEVVQLNRRDKTAYLVVRDPEVDMSLAVTISVFALDAVAVPLRVGARVVVQAKATFWPKRGTLQLDARQIRPVGVGDLLARIEVLKARLSAEGLFDPARKKGLPFLPRTVGLITGRDSAAERDVVENARRRWPSVRFAIRTVAVQGASAALDIATAVAELDADPAVDVIVIARGGGGTEELLAFSNEALVRAVAAATTPVVSAIGHDIDTPLLDFVADWRASTPTDAGKRVVPDAGDEGRLVQTSRERIRATLARRLEHERRRLVDVTTRPVMADRGAVLTSYREQVRALRRRARQRQTSRVERAADEAGQLLLRVRALSPQSTLERGYAVVEQSDGRIVRDPRDLVPGEPLHVRVARGDFAVRTEGIDDR